MLATSDAYNKIIVALDTTPAKALALAEVLKERPVWVKVGMSLYFQGGNEIIEQLKSMGLQIFLDLKLYDIPHQIELATQALAQLGIGMLTVHASGGKDMLLSAQKGLEKGSDDILPKLLAVTVLTSMDRDDLNSIGVHVSETANQVEQLAKLATNVGVSGFVSSPHEAKIIRGIAGNDAYIVTPGIRPHYNSTDDQKRIATPKFAILQGASHLVIGRPITQSDDPLRMVDSIATQIEGA